MDQPKKIGRPRKKIDVDLVQKLAGIMCTMTEIAAMCDCSVDLLEQRFSEIIKKGRENGKTSLRRHLWKMVEAGNTGVAIWLSKQHLGMSDKIEQKQDVTHNLNTAIVDLIEDIAEKNENN